MANIRTFGVQAIALATGLSLAVACGGDDDAAETDGSVTLTWWHNGTADPPLSTWQQVADDFRAQHPNVSFDIQPLQNEQFVTKVPLALQGDDPPDVYQQWGGGAMATQVQSGKLMDITDASADWIDQVGNAAKGWQVDGRQYGAPFDLHTVGFWYRKDLFAQAGITQPPTTMDEFYDVIDQLKSAGITPVAIGSKDKWPDAFYWEYFVLRRCSTDTVTEAIEELSMDDDCFVEAGEDLQELLDAEPFQEGFLGTTAQQGAGSSAGMVANGDAAMELQGDWELAVMPSLTDDKDFASKLGWFPFPAVEGGDGDQGATLGGGDGFSCTVDATQACVDFLEYLTSAKVQRQLVESSTATLPANPAANDAIDNPALLDVLEYSQAASFSQLYFDQALPTDVGQALNDAIANVFAGAGSPEDIPAAVTG
jgi:raffinose/stachyose/melibiose transport system substrate-binding protein